MRVVGCLLLVPIAVLYFTSVNSSKDLPLISSKLSSKRGRDHSAAGGANRPPNLAGQLPNHPEQPLELEGLE